MKSHNFTLILLVFSALMKSATAQLSGVYTIGGTTPDYATIQAAVTALQTSGVNGAVIFNIRPGTYSGKVDLGVVAGASATNTILFRAENFDSTSVIITDSASATGSNFTFHVFGTDYLTVSHVTVRRPGTNANSIVFSISSNSQHFQIRNCIIESNITTSTNSTSSLVSIPLGGVNDSLFTFANNIFRGGSMGLEIKGQGIGSPIPLMQITNNQFIDQSFRAMQLTYLISPNIQNNNISTHSTNTVYRGISLARGTGIITISANKITGINSGGDALHLDTCAGTLGNAAMIYNNFLQTQGTGTVRGLYMSNCTFLNIYYNSINITTTGGFNNAALYLNGSNNSQLNVKNNILMNTGGGYTYYIPVGALGNLVSSDHNDLYVASGDTTIAYLDTGDVSTLANWQTRSSLDANSVSGDPQFISATDLHAGSPAVNNLGVVITGITTDIDGQTRNVTTPDIGADEFTPLNANIGMVSFIAPETGICGDSAITVGVIIHNYGLNNQTGFPMHADITGAVVQNLTQNYSGSLVSNTSDTVYFTQTINTYSGGIIDITAYLSLAADQYRLNDTIRGSFEFGGHPNAPAAVSPQQQCDNNVQITATADSGDVLAWYADSIGGNLIFVGDTFSPGITSDTTFYVEARTGSGTGGCLRITEIDPNDTQGFDFVEIQNISGVGFDATGWTVVASENGSTPNTVAWNLGFFNAGEVQYKTDNFNDVLHYWGTNLQWVTGTLGWAMIIDGNGNIVDFVLWDDTTNIQSSMVITVNGFNITPGSEWIGNGYISCASNVNQRIGNDDHNNASDWICAPQSMGISNTNLASVFNSCGIGACGSPRIPVAVTLVSGITASLGNDTLIGTPFSITLDPGPGFTSYLWSTGDTTQTIVVTTYDIYWVTVTGGPNNCSYTDSINVSLNVGLNNMIKADEFSFYPNPATDKLMITGIESFLQSAVIRITDIQGREAKDVQWKKLSSQHYEINISDLKEGIYFLQVISGNRTGVQKFVVLGR